MSNVDGRVGDSVLEVADSVDGAVVLCPESSDEALFGPAVDEELTSDVSPTEVDVSENFPSSSLHATVEVTTNSKTSPVFTLFIVCPYQRALARAVSITHHRYPP